MEKRDKKVVFIILPMDKKLYTTIVRPNEGYLIAHTCKMNVQFFFFFMKEKRTNTHRMMNNIPVYFSI